MSQPAPVLTVAGRVHSVTRREVKPLAAQTEIRDPETNALVRPAREGRPGYSVSDVLILTPDGGFVTVVCADEAVGEGLSGTLPDRDSEVAWPVRLFVKWQGDPGRKYATVGLSLAGDVLARQSSTGRRLAAASSGS